MTLLDDHYFYLIWINDKIFKPNKLSTEISQIKLGKIHHSSQLSKKMDDLPKDNQMAMKIYFCCN